MPSSRKLRLGTRSSALALVQARWVADRLQQLGQPVELVQISTMGDLSSRPLTAAGGVGLFTKAIQEALLRDEIDLAVHSLKDLPTQAVPGLKLIAAPVRAAVEDVLITVKGHRIGELPAGCRIGTGSLRRQSQLLHLRPDLNVQDIRGNVETRLAKLHNDDYDALVLALAGVQRLNVFEDHWQIFATDEVLPAVGQGALGIEIRVSDTETAARLAPLNHQITWAAVRAERMLLNSLTAGCLAPVGAWARVTSNQRLRLDAVVLSTDGTQRILRSADDDIARPEALGRKLAQSLLDAGADQLIR